jgi:hypothetical protein
LRVSVNEKVSFFSGLNPGIYYPIEGEMSFVLAVEVGGIIYFSE